MPFFNRGDTACPSADFPDEEGQREPQRTADFGRSTTLGRSENTTKISRGSLQLERDNDLIHLEL